jgi:hypothetical protein
MRPESQQNDALHSTNCALLLATKIFGVDPVLLE